MGQLQSQVIKIVFLGKLRIAVTYQYKLLSCSPVLLGALLTLYDRFEHSLVEAVRGRSSFVCSRIGLLQHPEFKVHPVLEGIIKVCRNLKCFIGAVCGDMNAVLFMIKNDVYSRKLTDDVHENVSLCRIALRDQKDRGTDSVLTVLIHIKAVLSRKLTDLHHCRCRFLGEGGVGKCLKLAYPVHKPVMLCHVDPGFCISLIDSEICAYSPEVRSVT